MSFYLNFKCFRGEVHFVLITFSFLLQLSFLFLIFLYFVLSPLLFYPIPSSPFLSFMFFLTHLLTSSPTASFILRPYTSSFSYSLLFHALLFSVSSHIPYPRVSAFFNSTPEGIISHLESDVFDKTQKIWDPFQESSTFLFTPSDSINIVRKVNQIDFFFMSYDLKNYLFVYLFIY